MPKFDWLVRSSLINLFAMKYVNRGKVQIPYTAAVRVTVTAPLQGTVPLTNLAVLRAAAKYFNVGIVVANITMFGRNRVMVDMIGINFSQISASNR